MTIWQRIITLPGRISRADFWIVVGITLLTRLVVDTMFDLLKAVN